MPPPSPPPGWLGTETFIHNLVLAFLGSCHLNDHTLEYYLKNSKSGPPWAVEQTNFSTECQKTKTKIISITNQSKEIIIVSQRELKIKTGNLLEAGKCEYPIWNWFSFCIWLDKMVVKVLRPIIERRKEKLSNQDQFRYSTDERAA